MTKEKHPRHHRHKEKPGVDEEARIDMDKDEETGGQEVSNGSTAIERSDDLNDNRGVKADQQRLLRWGIIVACIVVVLICIIAPLSWYFNGPYPVDDPASLTNDSVPTVEPSLENDSDPVVDPSLACDPTTFCPDGITNRGGSLEPHFDFDCSSVMDVIVAGWISDEDCADFMIHELDCCPLEEGSDPVCGICGDSETLYNEEKTLNSFVCADMDNILKHHPRAETCPQLVEYISDVSGFSIFSYCECEGAEPPMLCPFCDEGEMFDTTVEFWYSSSYGTASCADFSAGELFPHLNSQEECDRFYPEESADIYDRFKANCCM